MGKKAISIAETQKVSLNILKVITKICDKLSLRYFLIYGTLIGAVRHQGYIPWDDDTDIMIPRPDYDKLLAYLALHESELRPLAVFNRQTCAQYPYMISRISDSRYHIVMENEKDYGLGIFIDIYPYDGLGNSFQEALKYGLKGDRMSSFCYQATRNHYAVETTTSGLRKVLKLPMFLVAKLIGENFFQNRLANLARKKGYDQSEYVGCVIWLSGGQKDIFKRSWFDDFSLVKFEDTEFRIPANYKEILEQVYGDYMKLPPKSERIGHHYYTVYKRD